MHSHLSIERWSIWILFFFVERKRILLNFAPVVMMMMTLVIVVVTIIKRRKTMMVSSPSPSSKTVARPPKLNQKYVWNPDRIYVNRYPITGMTFINPLHVLQIVVGNNCVVRVLSI